MIESRAPDIMQLCSISHDPIIWDRNADPIEKENTYSLTTSLHHELLLLLSSPTTVKLKLTTYVLVGNTFKVDRPQRSRVLPLTP